MPRFFVDTAAVRDGVVRIEGDDAAHLARSLRVRPGERIVVVEDGRLMHQVLITEVLTSRVSGEIQRTDAASGESGLPVHILQSVPAHGMDDAVEALTIAGAHEIHPVLSQRSVPRPDAAASGRRSIRWQSIAREAAQLAGRARPPLVSAPEPLHEALAALPPDCRILACVATPDATPISLVRLEGDAPVACVIGPEGGLGPEDLSTLRSAGSTEVHLGVRIIPTRLAGFLAVSLILNARGELNSAPTAAEPS